MNISELFQLTQWIKTEIADKQIVQKYQNLINIIDENIRPNRPPNATKKPFEQEKNLLLNTLREVPLNYLTWEQLNFLDKLKIKSNVGDTAAENVEGILYKNSIDEPTIISKIKNIIGELNQGIAQSNQMKGVLENCISPEEYKLGDNVLMRVNFSGNASIKNVVDLKKWSEAWLEIGRGITMANGEAPEKLEIIGTIKGSIIIEFVLAPILIGSFSYLIKNVLNLISGVYEIKIQIEEFKNLKLKNDFLKSTAKEFDPIIKGLEDTYEKSKNDGIEKITNDESERLKISNKNNDGEKITALKKATQNILNFIENGGGVDFVNPTNNEDREKLKELTDGFIKIRELENKVKQLEHKKSEN